MMNEQCERTKNNALFDEKPDARSDNERLAHRQSSTRAAGGVAKNNNTLLPLQHVNDRRKESERKVRLAFPMTTYSSSSATTLLYINASRGDWNQRRRIA